MSDYPVLSSTKGIRAEDLASTTDAGLDALFADDDEGTAIIADGNGVSRKVQGPIKTLLASTDAATLNAALADALDSDPAAVRAALAVYSTAQVDSAVSDATDALVEALGIETGDRIMADVAVASAAATDATTKANAAAAASLPLAGGTLTNDLTLTTTKRLLAGVNVLVGAVADKLNAIHLAIASQAVGDQLVADSTTSFARVAAVAAGRIWRATGVGAAPAWSTLTIPDTIARGSALVATAANTLTAVDFSTVDTFPGGDGVDLVKRTAAQVRTSLAIDPRYGTYAAIGAASSYPGASYSVDGGAGRNDVYESVRTGSGAYVWRLVSYDQFGELAPTVLFACDELTGSAFADSGSLAGGPLTITGSPALGRYAGTRRGALWVTTSNSAGGSGANGTTPPTGTGALTLSAWYVPTTVALSFRLIFGWLGTGGTGGCYVALNEAGTTGAVRVTVCTSVGGAESTWRSTATALVAGQLAHIVMVWNGSLTGNAKIALYVNGIAQPGAWDATMSATVLVYIAGHWLVGGAGSSTGAVGVVGRCAVHDGVAATQAQVHEFYARGQGWYAGQ